MKAYKLILTIAIAGVFINAAMAYGDTFTSTGDGGAWNLDATWLEAGYPDGADDTATILSGDTVTVNNCTAICGSLTVNDGGILDMQTDGQLDIEDELNIVGTFRFNDQTLGTEPILQATWSLEITGNIQTTSGADEGGVIADDGDGSVILMANSAISCQYGRVSISAPFENDGTVTANGTNAGYDITFSGAIAADSMGLFQVTAANSDMIFDHTSAVTLTDGEDPPDGGDFNVTAGRMYFQQDLTTKGGHRQVGGVLEVKEGFSFTAEGAYP